MAKLTGPLLSIGARGAVGKTLVAAEWRGVKYMRQYVIPANPRTTDQTEVRNIFAFLNGFWLIAPTDARAPWVANAVGKRYTDRNKLISTNLAALQGETDVNLFAGSPGALGGPPLEAVAASTGASAGEVDVDVTVPTTPTGWTLAGVVSMAFPDQLPTDPFGGPIAIDEVTSTPWDATLTGLGSGVSCQVTAWPVWTRPDGRTAYGASLQDQATSGA